MSKKTGGASESVDNGVVCLTDQTLREATVSVARNGTPIDEFSTVLPFQKNVPIPNRRCLRYATHGLHEYRGKFFPQLVKALINIGGVPSGRVVADPMCGSGTTLIEALLAGRTAVGLNMNPLSVRLSRAKCMLLRTEPERLRSVFQAVEDRLDRATHCGVGVPRYLDEVPVADQEYLRRWFSDAVLHNLDSIVAAIRPVRDSGARELLFIALSNVLRRVSWQKTDDLRVRRDFSSAEVDTISTFVAEARKSLRSVAAFLYQNGRPRSGSYDICPGDARCLALRWSRWRGRVDAIITSPPYATALPYLDTDRLNLCYLKMLTRQEHRDADRRMIGNREITERTRKEYWGILRVTQRRYLRRW